MPLSIIIPCYNEEARIAPTLDRIRAYLNSRDITGEIIVVNDGSTDGTLAILNAQKDIRVFTWDLNRGKGAAVREGMLNATRDIILFTDADLSTPIEEADKLLVLLKNYDVVIGSRQVPGKRIEKYQAPHRLLLGMAFGYTVRIVFRLRYHDTQCGFKAMTQNAAATLAKHMKINGFTFDVEMLCLADQLGLKVTEVGVRWRDVAGSKLNPRRDFGKIIAELIEIRKNINDFGH